jgi:hypothetical protein
MRTQFLIGSLLIGMIMATQQVNAQVTIANNTAGGANYVGWANTVGVPLQIRHDANNQPINIFTGGTGAGNLRMRINANNATEAQTAEPTAGYVGIGPNTNLFSRLTISNSATGTVGGYRRWMKTGVFSHEGTDNMYVGLRQQDGIANRFDATIVWSDNPTAAEGIDKLRFIFTSPPIGGGVGNTNPRATESVNGYEFMLMTPFPALTNSIGSPVGHVGIGPMFNDINLPQNRLHINAEDNIQTFIQISNELGTGQGANDGLRFGYPTTTASNLEVQINQRENDRLSLYTNNGERMRIMHTGALNNGVTFPGAGNFTRIGISHNPTTPVTRPLSLLHLGYNVSNATNNDGWRNWMDVGTFASQNSDHVYLGLKPEAGNGSDAVLAWGDNSGPVDNFKVLFTTPLGGLAIPSATPDGVEALRMTPTLIQGIFTGIGGDPVANPYLGGSSNPTAALEVNAWGAASGTSGLRFTDLNSTATPVANPGAGVLSVNSTGDVIYVNASNAPQVGNYCGNPQNPLTNNFEIPLNGFSYSFTAGTNDNSTVNIGNVACGTQLPARLYVQQTDPIPGAALHTAIVGLTDGGLLPSELDDPSAEAYGIYGGITGARSVTHAGVFGTSIAANNDIFTADTRGLGVWGTASFNDVNIGVYGVAEDVNADINYGVWGKATGASTANFAGFFDGDVSFNGNVLGSQFAWTSDSIFKTSVDTIANPVAIINQLKPKTYFYDTSNIYNLHFPEKRQYGFIAQQVEQILPELVSNSYKPADYDTSGNEIAPAVSYRSLNYNALLGIIVAAMQKQQENLDEKDSLITSLHKRLKRLEKCIKDANLCGPVSGTSYKQDESEETQVSTQDIELSNLQNIILDQNVPNPFAEKTIIRYLLPDDIKTAEIIFHDAQGKQIKQAQINTRGRGEINVYAQDLSSGVYTYTLIADGNVIDTKRMVKR